MPPLLVPTHITCPDDETAIAVIISFLSLRGAYSSCELIMSPFSGQTCTMPVVEPRSIEGERASSTVLELAGTNLRTFGDETDIDMGDSCL